MNVYDEAIEIMIERFGNSKDNLISLATIDRELSADGKTRPVVRNVDAHYEDGVFYVVTYGMSNKMQQIAVNQEVSIDVCNEWFSSSAIGENLGWVLKEENADIRAKLRKTFEAWYDFANNENDENCVILAIKLKHGTLIKDHFAVVYKVDFEAKTATK